MRSGKETDTIGVGDPEYDVDFILAAGDETLYRYTDQSTRQVRFYTDPKIETRDLTGKRNLVVTFHSGEHGVSDWRSREHVVMVPSHSRVGWDISPDNLAMSRRHQTRWVEFQGRTLILRTEPINPNDGEDEHACHACDKYYAYLVYEWDAKRKALVLRQSILSERVSDADTDPLNADMPFIRERLRSGG